MWTTLPEAQRAEIERLSFRSFRFDLQLFANDPDRTEEATPKKKQEARRKGQVAKSAELNSIVVLLSLFLILNALGSWFYNVIDLYIRQSLSVDILTKELSMPNLGLIFRNHLLFFGQIFIPLGFGAMLIGVVVNYLQVGALFTLEPLKPKFSHLNPLNGFQKIFSTRGLVDLVKSVLKLSVILYLAYTTIKDRVFILLDTVQQTPREVAFLIWDILFNVVVKICLFLLILALFDYFYQRWELRKNLRMTKKEVKDEYKQTEGNPQIKSKIRQRQRQIASRRMMQDVPKADVVITNPTHLAIALKYDSITMAAPTIVAKGAGVIAEKIKEIAKANGVAVVENKPLAQALFKTVEIGESIPAKLYQAVAEVLAFVYRLKQKSYARR